MTSADIQVVFEDLMSRFIINVPEQEIATTDRICFQIEQAHWFYEDFIRENDSSLPGFKLKQFAAEMFNRCPLLKDFVKEQRVEEIYDRFVAYKLNVPVCGAIILNQNMDKILLVRGYAAKSSWTFPKGKINQNETEAHCAIREVMEECGFDISPYINENEYVEILLRGEQRNRLYMIPNISEQTHFQPQTRKEIGDIRWHNISDLPRFGSSRSNSFSENDRKYYMIKVFMGEVLKWIKQRQRASKKRSRRKTGGDLSSTSLPKSLDGNVASADLKAMLGIAHSNSAVSIQSGPPALDYQKTPVRQSSASQSIQFAITPVLSSKQSSLLSILKGTATDNDQRDDSRSISSNKSELLDILKGQQSSSSLSPNTKMMPLSVLSQASVPSISSNADNASEHLKGLMGISQQNSTKSLEINGEGIKQAQRPRKDVKILGYAEQQKKNPRRKSAGPRLETPTTRKIQILKRPPSEEANETKVAPMDDETNNNNNNNNDNNNMGDFKFNMSDIMSKLFLK